jgi:hypothetical protein
VRGQANGPRVLALGASLVAGLCVAAAPAVADPGHGRQATTPTTVTSPGSALAVQGVVQAVSPSTVLVKQLDGSAVIVPVDRRTQVFVNGRPAAWADVKPGFVLIASWQAGKAATALHFLRPS